MSTEHLEKRIKKTVYGRPQSVVAVFPAGFSTTALAEIETILANSWFPQKYTPQLTLLNNAIRIDQVHLFSIVELLMRSRCLSDIRLVIAEGKASGRAAFQKKCIAVPWDFYLNSSMVIMLQATSVASHAFHETGLKEILADSLSPYTKKIVKGDDATATTRIDANLDHDYLTISISLAGNALYKRGYRTTLSESAPLREDIAACCIDNALRFAHQTNKDYLPDALYVPFSGTGTFIFEYMIKQHNLAPVLFGRDYALQAMPLFRSEHFQYILKKSLANIHQDTSTDYDGIDFSESAVTACKQNLTIFSNALLQQSVDINTLCKEITLRREDFFKATPNIPTAKNIFMPLNPPYGIRLAKNTDQTTLYKNIAKQITTLMRTQQIQQIAGFVLCPTRETWLAFCSALPNAALETYHMTQGGLDVRVCQFLVS